MRKGARKLIYCTNCKEPFKVEIDDNGTPLAIIVPYVDFELSCILCGAKLHDKIPDYPGALKEVTCQNCDLNITVAKTKDGVNTDAGYKKRLPPKFVKEVLANLPSRPWPKGIHKIIAERMGVSNSAVSSAIAKLLDEKKIPE